MPLRRREGEDVDVVAGLDVLEKRCVVHDDRRDCAIALGQPQELVHERPPLDIRREPEREGQPAACGVAVDEDTLPARISRDLVEEDGRRSEGVDQHFGDLTDIRLPGRAFHRSQFAHRVGARDPVAEIRVFHECLLP